MSVSALKPGVSPSLVRESADSERAGASGSRLAIGRCQSLAQLFVIRVSATPEALAYRYWSQGSYYSLNWRGVGERVRWLSCGLLALDVKREDRCAILSNTRLEWLLADLAVLCAGAATTTIYPSSPPADCVFILADSGSVVAFVERAEQAAQLREQRAGLPALRRVVVLEGEAPNDEWVISLAELERIGREYEAAHASEFQRVVESIAPKDLAMLVYTSGTTGRPKGVRLLHDGWLYQVEAAAGLGLLSPEDHQFLWLPLANVMGKVFQFWAIRCGFPTTVDARLPELMDNLVRERPTFTAAPPKVFEKMYGRIALFAQLGGPVKQAVFAWACRVGRAMSRCKRAGNEPSGVLRAQHKIADKLVFEKVRARFGGRMRFMFSGGAALSPELAEFFHAAGILVLEGYGLTETCAGAVLNLPHAFAFGSVGKPNPGTELAFDTDGEILLRSRGVLQGYHGLPEETRATLSSDGWFRTGDIGRIDERGFLYITERKKELIKTSAGLYVAPQKIEGLLKAGSALISQAVVHGDGRGYCCALIDVDRDLLGLATKGTTIPAADALAAIAVPQIIAGIAKVNQSLASHECIRRFAILPAPLAVDSGLLTASMKVRRRAVEQRYAALLDEIYRRPAPARPHATPEWVSESFGGMS